MRSLLLLTVVAQLAATSMGFFLPSMAPTSTRRHTSSAVQVRNDWTRLVGRWIAWGWIHRMGWVGTYARAWPPQPTALTHNPWDRTQSTRSIHNNQHTHYIYAHQQGTCSAAGSCAVGIGRRTRMAATLEAPAKEGVS